MDVEDLRRALENGDTIKDAARFLCRATSVDGVEAKARELGLPVRHESSGQLIAIEIRLSGRVLLIFGRASKSIASALAAAGHVA